MEKLKMMKENLMTQVCAQMGNLQNIDTKELGEAIDMIKDLEEAIYYCSITGAMEESQEEKRYSRQSRPMMYNNYSRMYYEDEQYPLHLQPHESAVYLPEKMQMERDRREGRSPINRRKYMESKQMHRDEMAQKKELEEYMNELSRDISEMIADAAPDHKALMSQKLNALAAKIQ